MIILNLFFLFFFHFDQWTRNISYLSSGVHSGISLFYETTSRKGKVVYSSFLTLSLLPALSLILLKSFLQDIKIKSGFQPKSSLMVLMSPLNSSTLLLTCSPALPMVLWWLLLTSAWLVLRCRQKRAPCVLSSLWCTNAWPVII